MWRLHTYTVCEWLLYKHLETHLAPKWRIENKKRREYKAEREFVFLIILKLL